MCPVTLRSNYAQDGGTDKGRDSGQGQWQGIGAHRGTTGLGWWWQIYIYPVSITYQDVYKNTLTHKAMLHWPHSDILSIVKNCTRTELGS